MIRRPPETPEPLDAATIVALGEALPPAELSAHRRASLRVRVLARVADTVPDNTETIRGDGMPWRQMFPNVWAKVMKRDPESNLQITLFRMEPGGVVPGHVHTMDEECLVLEGEVLIGSHAVRKGDLHIAHAGARHPDMWTRSGALIMVRSEVPPAHLR
ncbi:MAG: cupin domain-containing protein [Gammaproteobacteria bacterium]